MNVLIGLAGLLAVFWYAAMAHDDAAALGIVHVPALLLLLVGPLCVAIMSFTPEQLRDALVHLWRGARANAGASRRALYEDLTRFAQELRRGNAAAALDAADGAEHPLMRLVAPLVVKQYDASALEQTAGTAAHVLVSSVRRSEAVLNALARMAPAMGLIGTVLGLIKLLRDLSDFSQLGPSMALALLCTLYGLLLANAVYQPLSRRVHTWSVVLSEEARLLTRGLLLIREGKPMADLRALFETTEARIAVQADPPPDLAQGGTP